MARLNTCTKEERDAVVQQMLAMQNEGKTYQQIGDAFGISKQRVYQMIGNADNRFFRYIGPNTCIYKGVRKYLNDNKISIAEFVRRAYGLYAPRNFYAMRNRLSGATDITKTYIDKILEITGLTYEVAFELESNA